MSEAWRGDDLGQVAVEEQSLELQSCATKLWTIREVLLRRHMKVAFFGRYVTHTHDDHVTQLRNTPSCDDDITSA